MRVPPALRPPLPRLHVFTDEVVLARPDLVKTGRALLSLGVALHLRGWKTSVRARLQLAEELLVQEGDEPSFSGILQIHDRLDLALALRHGQRVNPAWRSVPVGVHLPEAAFPAAEARTLLGVGGSLGRSIHGPHTERELDYLVLGTLFATPSHPGRPGAGWDLLDRVMAAEGERAKAEGVPPLPIVGIGGMSAERARELRRRGGWGVAVLRGVWEASGGASPLEAAHALLQALDERI